MRRITKFFVFLLLLASLGASLLNIGFYRELKERTEALYRRDLRHWLSLQSRMEIVEEAISSPYHPHETEPTDVTEAQETVLETHPDTSPESEDITDGETEESVTTDATA